MTDLFFVPPSTCVSYVVNAFLLLLFLGAVSGSVGRRRRRRRRPSASCILKPRVDNEGGEYSLGL